MALSRDGIVQATGTTFTPEPGIVLPPAAIRDVDLSLTDVTNNNVSTTRHGFAPKSPGGTTQFLRADGWAHLNDYTSYTPTWTATVTNPNFYSIAGAFVQTGKFVQAVIVINCVHITTYGSGVYVFSLPVPYSSLIGSANLPLGSAMLFHSSANQVYPQIATIGGGAVVLQSYSAPAALMTPTVPFTLAEGDNIQISLNYIADTF